MTYVLRYLLVFLAPLAIVQAQAATDSIYSPSLRALRAEVTAGDSAAVSRFWQRIGAKGAPIVEDIAEDPRFQRVTFLYRGGRDTRSVAAITLENHQLANDRYFALGRLGRLQGTDVWYRTYRLRSDARFTYRLSPNDDRLFADLQGPAWTDRVGHARADSLNPRRVKTRDGVVSLVELRDAPKQPWITRDAAVPRGTLDSASLPSTTLGNERTIKIYTPPGYEAGSRATNLVVVLDGESVPDDMPIPTILDNLIAARRLGPTIGVMVGNAPGARPAELSYSPAFATFVRRELMPWIRARYRVPTDPARIVIAGQSLGGSAAAHLGVVMPELFGNVLTQSGGFAARRTRATAAQAARQPEQLVEDDFPEGEWLTRELATTPRRRLRFYLDVGTLEDVAWEFPRPQYATPTVLVANRHLRDVLEAKGYWVRYREINGPHDPLSWRGTFGDALISLIGQ
jgi:enterochelin esterase-like enzyme